MSKIFIKSSLPVALTVLVAGASATSKDIEFSDISSVELMTARQNAKEKEFLIFHEYAAKVKLIDKDGNKHDVPYSVIAHTSSANLRKFEELDYELTAKLAAESS